MCAFSHTLVFYNQLSCFIIMSTLLTYYFLKSRIKLSHFISHNITSQFVRALISTTSKSEYASKAMKKEKWKSVVGLEIHAQISSASKLFSGASTEFGSPVNTSVAFFDAAVPGTLPVLNRRCVEAGVLTALALSCKINPISLFDRKHYFYSDLPSGYQITQQRSPLAQAGEVHFQVFTPGVNKKPYTKMSRLYQLQLEQDSGKSLHDEETHSSLVDLNRAGIPLMELVFEPDLENGEEAAALVRELSLIFGRLGTCSCKMEEGALRVDANISVHREGEPLGVRSEIKNISSIRGVANAIRFEIERQHAILLAGGVIVNETRAWDAQNRQTLPMRDKEEIQDYRYMPEPNLPPLHVAVDEQSFGLVDARALRNQLPELPEETRRRLREQYGLSLESSIILVNENILLQHFSAIMEKEGRDPRLVTNILTMELLGLVHKSKVVLQDCPVSSEVLGELVDLYQKGTVNLLTVRKLLQEAINGNPKTPTQITEEYGWAQITDKDDIRRICQDVLDKNPKLVQQFHAGKSKVFGALVGEVAKTSEQRTDMAAVVQQLKVMLAKT